MHRGIVALVLAASLTLLSCQSNEGPAPEDGPAVAADATTSSDVGSSDVGLQPDAATSDVGVGPVACTLGTVYPNSSVIDPDNPKYSDSKYTAVQVKTEFAQAKQFNSKAYKAYKAAFEHPELMECGFCPCGCQTLDGHESAIDCFKDMHGFG